MRGLAVVTSALVAAALYAPCVVGQSNTVDPVIIKVRLWSRQLNKT